MSMKNDKKKTGRPIYDQNYYKAQAMIRDPWFIDKIVWLKQRFTETGCPLPKKPFKNYKQYYSWNDKFWKHYAEMEKSTEFAEAKLRITGGKQRFTFEELDALERFKEDFLPPVYGQTYTEILQHFKIDYNDRGFRDFLERYIFFGRTGYPTPHFYVTLKRNQKTQELELFIRILGHTKKEDIVKGWAQISKEQKHLKNYIGKNKEWETFERDIEIYDHYKKIKDSMKTERSADLQAVDMKIFIKLHKKWPELTTVSIRTIVTKTKKRLGEI